MSTSRVAKIDIEILELTQRIALAEQAHSGAALVMVQAPKDKAAAAKAKELEDAIDEDRKQIARLRKARAEAERLDAADERNRELAKTTTAFARSVAAARKRVEIHAKIERMIEQLDALLDEHRAATAECIQNAGYAGTRSASSQAHWLSNSHLVMQHAAAENGHVARALSALYTIAPAGSRLRLSEIMAVEADRLQFRLGELVERKAQEVAELNAGVDRALEARREASERAAAERNLRISRGSEELIPLPPRERAKLAEETA